MKFHLKLKSLKRKSVLIAAAVLLAFVVFASSGLSARIPLPSWLPEALRDFFERNPDFSMEPYKDGTIILVKPIATGVGEGRYEAGDIVEIRDGSKPLGKEERTMLLPLYYPGKIDEKLKEELMKPIESVIARSSSDEAIPSDNSDGGLSSGSPRSADGGLARDDKKILARRSYGVDYTKFLNGREILKVRRFEPLTQLPEIDLNVIINKENKLSLKENQKALAYSQGPLTRRATELHRILGEENQLGINQGPALAGDTLLRLRNINYNIAKNKNNSSQGEVAFDSLQREYGSLIDTQYFHYTPSQNLVKGGGIYSASNLSLSDSDKIPSLSDSKTLINLPWYLSFAEKTRNTITRLARSLVAPAYADVAETVKIVDPGNGTGTDYVSLNAWEAAMQADITSGGTNTISVAKLRATNGTADTTAVTVSGWTTDAAHYIKIWTDPNESFRHSGKYDTGKYRLEISNFYGILVSEDYVKIDGLQIKITSVDSSGNDAVQVGTLSSGLNKAEISNNLLVGVLSGTGGAHGIYSDSTNDNIDIWNNTIYGFNLATKWGIIVYGTTYIYNNTVYNSTGGIRGVTDNSSIAKNNLVASSTTSFTGTFAAGTDYNATDNASMGYTVTGGGNSHDRTSQSFYFTDKLNSDFRLAEADTGAKGQGVNLTSDVEIPVTSDVEGQPRPASGNIDIGADQFAATPIYRSVGPSNTTAIASSTGATLTISGSSATFSSGMPANMGVGDVIVYQSLNGTTKNSLAFIHGRTNETTYTVKDVAGHIASSTSVSTNWQVFRAYTSLSTAESGDENNGLPDSLEAFESWSGGKNLASSTEQWNIAAYADAADTTAVTVNGWTTATSTYIRIYTPYQTSEVGASQRHNGKWDSSKFRFESTSLYAFDVYTSYTRFEGLQVKQTYNLNNNSRAFLIRSGTYSSVNDNIIWGVISGSANGYGIDLSVSGYAKNNIIYGFLNGSNGVGINVSATNNYVYNNTVYGNTIGIYSNYQAAILKNNISYNNTTDYSVNVAWNTGSTNNLSKDATAPAYGTYYRNRTVNFVDSANSDFHLSPSDVWAKDNGADLSADANLAFSTDIDGEQRPGGSAWDIGADESKAAAQVGKPQTNFMNDDSLVGYWSFDGSDMNWASTTAEALDRSGNNNNGNVTNFTKTSVADGKVGQALSFDGTNDYVDVGYMPSISGLSQFSASVWVKSNSFVKDYTFVSKYDSAFSVSQSVFLFGTAMGESGGTNNDVGFRFGGGSIYGRSSGSPLANGQWNHVVAVYDGSQSTDATRLKMYVNGAQVTLVFAGTVPATLPSSNDSKTIIGATDNLIRFHSGLIDEVRLYNRALALSEVEGLYKAGAAKMQVATPPKSGASGLASGLVGYWSFNGPDVNWASSTAEILDRSGSSPANNGNATNMSLSSVADGKLGQGLSFDGVDDYVNISSFAPLTNKTYTFSVWYKNTKSSLPLDDAEFLVDICGSWCTSRIIIFFTANNSKMSGYYDTSTGYHSLASAPTDQQWHNTTFTFDNDASIGTYYLDGNLVATSTYTGQNIGTSNSGSAIGSKQSFNSSFFQGLIDEVRVYNRALSVSEIQALYQQGSKKAQFKKN